MVKEEKLQLLLDSIKEFCEYGYNKGINPLPSVREYLGIKVLFKWNIDYAICFNETASRDTEPYLLVEAESVEQEEGRDQVYVSLTIITGLMHYTFGKATLRAMKQFYITDEEVLDIENSWVCNNK